MSSIDNRLLSLNVITDNNPYTDAIPNLISDIAARDDPSHNPSSNTNTPSTLYCLGNANPNTIIGQLNLKKTKE